MRPRQEASEEQIKELQLAMESETRKRFYRRLQCVWLRIKHDMATESVSQATGLTPSYIRKLWARFFRGGLQAIIGKPKGVRRNQHMTPKEEEQFLASHLAMAQKGWILTARKIKESYEQKNRQNSARVNCLPNALAQQLADRFNPSGPSPRRSRRTG